MHPSFHVCRRFSTVRARLLLRKQDQIVTLERRLEHLDQTEHRRLFLASLRHDVNPDREGVLNELDKTLLEYGMYTDHDTFPYLVTICLRGIEEHGSWEAYYLDRYSRQEQSSHVKPYVRLTKGYPKSKTLGQRHPLYCD